MLKKICVIFICMICLCYYFWPKNEAVDPPIDYGVPIQSFEVTLKGAVVFPGIYTFFTPISLSDIITIYAKGFLEDAYVDQMNIHQMISKNIVIEIPFVFGQEPIEKTKTNINQANYQELIQVPHITERIALQILLYRETYGRFNTYESILDVKYIGAATLEKIKPFITLG